MPVRLKRPNVKRKPVKLFRTRDRHIAVVKASDNWPTATTSVDFADDNQPIIVKGSGSAVDDARNDKAGLATKPLLFSKDLDFSEHQEYFLESHRPSPEVLVEERKFEL